MALDFYEARFTGSWGRDYLTGRLGVDLAGDERFRPGYAPAGWTTLVDHLGGRGVTDDELSRPGSPPAPAPGPSSTGSATVSCSPSSTSDQILGFVGRRHPDLTDDDEAGPKYLNTADTVAVPQGRPALRGRPRAARRGRVPVLVEGPIDALAVTLAGDGRYVGVAPLGTALTDEQASQLATLSTLTRSSPPTPTSPAGSPPNATSGS